VLRHAVLQTMRDALGSALPNAYLCGNGETVMFDTRIGNGGGWTLRMLGVNPVRGVIPAIERMQENEVAAV
jgi:hypothetical protein